MTEGHTERLEAALDGKYRIERKLGEGGMASVYLAEDIKHHRKVALKILKPELAAVIGAERFLSEIRTTANLQHPHILALFDSGEAGGYLYYVMPYIEGETLRDKLDREKQLGVEESIQIARDVADALDYAHRQGVIHRDIKPANILLHDGRPVVADFGIALAVSAAGGGRMTETGLSLGTPHYMSPEQASADRDLSARSDVYSLGCVLYEMIGGQPPHSGPSAQSILVHILTEEAKPLSKLRHTVPPNVAATVAKSIEKLPADRFESAKAFIEALGDVGFTYQAAARAGTETQTEDSQPTSSPVSRGPGILVATAAASVALTVLAMSVLGRLGADPPASPAVFEIDVHELDAMDITISPDGSALAFTTGANGPEERGLYVRRLEESDFRLIPGLGVPQYVSFSPDGEWMAYVNHEDQQNRRLMRVPVAGGGAETLFSSDETGPFDVHWGEDGTIIFIAVRGEAGIYRMPAFEGGEPERISEHTGRNPFVLPDGSGVLAPAQDGSIHVVDLTTESFPSELLIAEGGDPAYVGSGHIIYSHPTGGLFAVPFDLGTHEVTGPPARVLDDVATRALWKGYSVSRDGALVYTQGPGRRGGAVVFMTMAQPVLLDREGPADTLRLTRRMLGGVRFSPDGSRVAFHGSVSGDAGASHVFLYDRETSRSPQLTFEGQSIYPLWSPDGTRIAFSSRGHEGDDDYDLYVMEVDGQSVERRVLAMPGRQRPSSWPTEDVIVFTSSTGPGTGDIYTIPPSGEVDPTPYLQADFLEVDATVSPDGRWAAYASTEGGAALDIYIRSFPDPRGRPQRVSTGGGEDPRWSPDGSTLYYWNSQGGSEAIFSVDVENGAALSVGEPELAFEGSWPEFSWDVHPVEDGRVLVSAPAGTQQEGDDGTTETRHLIIQNWFTELRERLGEN